MNRKTFLTRLSTLTIGAGCPGFLAACVSLPYVTGVPSESGVAVSLESMSGMTYALLDIPGQPAPIFLARGDDGAFTAVSLHCTHRGCVVKPAGDSLECPCHGSQYTFQGGLIKGPAPRDLARFEVKERAGSIIILTPRP
jgi:Rieske Fe-S protein